MTDAVMTTISLPSTVSDRWQELLQRYTDLPDDYDYTAAQQRTLKEYRAVRPKVLKTREVYTVPYHGPEHPTTALIGETLRTAIWDAYDLMEDITSSHQSKLQQMLQRWITHGHFGLPKPTRPAKTAQQAEQEAAQAAFRQEVEAEARRMIQHACALLRKSESPMTPPSGFHADMVIKMSWHPNRVSSNGGYWKGKPHLSLVLKNMKPDAVTLKDEYAHIEQSPVIGSFRGPWQVRLAGVIAHEVAHAAQFTAKFKRGSVFRTVGKRDLSPTHGSGWQEIYRYLRESWVNQMEGFEAAH